MKRRWIWLTALAAFVLTASERVGSESWHFIDNGTLRLGVNRDAAAAIGWLSESGRERNLLNRFDLGRYVQQSWYGEPDDSDWNGQPWRWNPVQAGGWKGEPGKLLSFETPNGAILSSSIPRHWASGKLLDEVQFSQSIRLEGSLAIIEFRMQYSGETRHPVCDQELPAVFVDDSLTDLVFRETKEGELRRIVPGWPNERYSLAEPWAAYLGPDDRGLGVCVPDIDTITCYRAPGDPANRNKGACSYVAPLTRTTIEPGFEYEYTVYLTIGTLDEIRARFQPVMESSTPPIP